MKGVGSRPDRWKGGKKVAQHRYFKKKQARIQELMRRLKSAPCTDCSRTYPYYVMDFDHVRGEKKDTVCNLAKKWSALSTLVTEIEKCELVCSNCHRIRTHNRAQEKFNG